MKRIQLVILSFLFVCFIGSCNNQSKNSTESEYEEDSVSLLNKELEVPMEVTTDFIDYERSKLRFFLTNFIKNNPDVFNNEIAMEKYSEKLKKELDKRIQSDSLFIMDLPVHYDQILSKDATDIKTGKKMYVISCKPGDFLRDNFSSNDKFEYDVEYSVVGGVSEDDMIKIEKNVDYRIIGLISSRVDEDYNGKTFGISKGRTFNLGCFFVKDLKLVKFNDDL